MQETSHSVCDGWNVPLCIYKSNDSCCSEDDPEETFPASRVISSQILGYDGGEVDTKERVEVTFPVNVRMC